MSDCSNFWSAADYMPLKAIIAFWCEGQHLDCEEARKQAILSACENGEIEYIRTDGKDFADPVYDLYSRGVLHISRKSFIEWASQFHTPEEQDIQSPIRGKTKREQTLLRVIGALVWRHYARNPAYATDEGKPVYSAIAEDIVKGIEDKTGLRPNSIRKTILPDAIKDIQFVIKEAMKEHPQQQP